MSQLSPASKKSLRALASSLRAFAAAGLTVSQLEVFLVIALREGGVTVTEIADELGAEVSAVSRTVALLGKHGRAAKPGLRWVAEVDVEGDRRSKMIHLTAKGSAVAEKATSSL